MLGTLQLNCLVCSCKPTEPATRYSRRLQVETCLNIRRGRITDDEAGHLWKILCSMDETFEYNQLRPSNRAHRHFDATCMYIFAQPSGVAHSPTPILGQLKSRPPRHSHPFAMSIKNDKVLEEEDLLTTAALVQRCLRLDPKSRATAEDLLQWERAV
jgi:hypothetical protein